MKLRCWRLLEDYPVTASTVLDLFFGALDAMLNYSGLAEGGFRTEERVGSGIVMVFGAGFGGLMRLADPMPTYRQVLAVHPAIGVLYATLPAAGVLAFLAFLGGGVPIVGVAAHKAWRDGNRAQLRVFGRAVACVVAAAGATLALALLLPGTQIHPWGAFLVTGCLIVIATLLIVGTVMVARLVSATPFEASQLRWVSVPALIIAFGMGVAWLTALGLIIVVTAQAPQLLNSQDVTRSIFVASLLLMSAGCLFTGWGLRRGLISLYSRNSNREKSTIPGARCFDGPGSLRCERRKPQGNLPFG